MTDHRDFLEKLYGVAIAAAHPRALVNAAVDTLHKSYPAARRTTVIAIGKAAATMTHAAVERLSQLDVTIVGGITVGVDDGPPAHDAIGRLTGDHPLPGRRSLQAAAALGVNARGAIDTADVALVLVSGGATSLVGAPVDGVTARELAALYDALLRSGWDIAAMNDVRKRFLRWGAGRLALALAPIPVGLGLLSDVIGDDPRTIASGPCTPDPLYAADIQSRLDALAPLDAATRTSLTSHLRAVSEGDIPETPKADHPAFRSILPPIIHGNTTALEAVAAHARSIGWSVDVADEPLRGDARERGAAIATTMLGAAGQNRCFIYGGETTVVLPATTAHLGGRCQELALAAAQVIDGGGARAAPMALLAAGTDGRDGPTDAAGAIVDANTWRRIRDGGITPDDALASHDSHRALGAANALLPARATGTNVMDLVVGLVGKPLRSARDDAR